VVNFLVARKKNVSRTLTKAPGAIIRPFLESGFCQKKKNASRTLNKVPGAILSPFLEKNIFC
jgi:hypothetical protein